MNTPELTQRHGFDLRYGLASAAPLIGLLVGGIIAAVSAGTTAELVGAWGIVTSLLLWVGLLIHGRLTSSSSGDRRRRRRFPSLHRTRANGRSSVESLASNGILVRAGDYFASRRTLYRIEHVAGRRALVEDCRNGDLIDMGVDELSFLRPVNRGGQRIPGKGQG